MSDRPAAIAATSPVDMSNPPFDMSNGLSAAGGSVVTVPMNELLQPPHPPTTTGMYPIVVGGRFPDLGWDPALRAQVVLAEFAATNWQEQLDPGPPDDTPASLLDEITSMISPAMLLQRSRRLAEIITQAEDASLYWTDMLMLTVSARPWTCCLIAIGQAVGQLVAMHFKYKYMRARPVQVYPAIMPPVTTPGHPSYPNSHALQSHLMSLGVATACPALRDPLMALADRVGENRVIAGLHFPSDTSTSERLARNILPILAAGVEFQKVLTGAAAELQGLSTYPPQQSNAPA